MKIKMKLLRDDAVVPTRAHPTDCGYDLTATDIEIDKHGNLTCYTGLEMAIPEGYGGFIFPRSSVSKQPLALANCVGVIDPPYRGELLVKFKPSMFRVIEEIDDDSSRSVKRYRVELLDDSSIETYQAGDKVAQLIIMPVEAADFLVVDDLDATERGDGGFGSTD